MNQKIEELILNVKSSKYPFDNIIVLYITKSKFKYFYEELEEFLNVEYKELDIECKYVFNTEFIHYINMYLKINKFGKINTLDEKKFDAMKFKYSYKTKEYELKEYTNFIEKPE